MCVICSASLFNLSHAILFFAANLIKKNRKLNGKTQSFAPNSLHRQIEHVTKLELYFIERKVIKIQIKVILSRQSCYIFNAYTILKFLFTDNFQIHSTLIQSKRAISCVYSFQYCFH